MKGFAGLGAFRTCVCLTALLFLGVFLVYPLATVLLASVQDADTGAWTLTPYRQIFASR